MSIFDSIQLNNVNEIWMRAVIDGDLNKVKALLGVNTEERPAINHKDLKVRTCTFRESI